MELQFDTYGNDKQKQVCQHWNDPIVSDIAYGGSKGSGKSYLGCSLIFGDALTYDETHYFIARKKLNDLRKFTIPSIHEVFNHWGLDQRYYSFNGQDNVFTLNNGSKVFLLEAKYLPQDPLYQRYGSMQMTRGWIEEAGEFEEAAKNNLFASIGRWKNDVYNLPLKLLQTCNPSKNYLYREYYKKNKDNSLESWRKFIQALPTDNKRLPAGYLENLHRTLSKNEKERLLFGNWEYDDDPATLIPIAKIADLFTNEFVPSGQMYITADIARYGSDTTLIMVWSGLRVIRIIQLRKKATTAVSEMINGLRKIHSVPMSNVVIDEDGVGGGVVDQLDGCYGFVNNSSALFGENFSNLKSQCYFKLADLINANEIYVDCDDPDIKDKLTEELEQVKQKDMDKDGKKAVIPKDKVKELIGRSPDISDTLMMRMVFEIEPVADFWVL